MVSKPEVRHVKSALDLTLRVCDGGSPSFYVRMLLMFRERIWHWPSPAIPVPALVLLSDIALAPPGDVRTRTHLVTTLWLRAMDVWSSTYPAEAFLRQVLVCSGIDSENDDDDDGIALDLVGWKSLLSTLSASGVPDVVFWNAARVLLDFVAFLIRVSPDHEYLPRLDALLCIMWKQCPASLLNVYYTRADYKRGCVLRHPIVFDHRRGQIDRMASVRRWSWCSAVARSPAYEPHLRTKKPKL